MKKISLSVSGLFMAGLCVIALSLNGCGGEKADSAKKETTTGKSTTTQEQRPVPSNAPITQERTYYDFETDLNGWEIPMWAEGKTEYVAKEAVQSNDFASQGEGSMKMTTDFSGGMWTAGLVEIQQYLDLSGYRVVSADIYLPEGAPMGLKAKLILTVGNNWKFVEMSRSVALIPGEWVTITANIEPGSYDWKRVVPNEEFAEDVRKVAIRIESNQKPKYTGPIYIDNIRAGK